MNTAGVTSEDKTPIRTRKGVGWLKSRNVVVERSILNWICYKRNNVTHEQASVDRMARDRTKGKEELSEMAKEAPTMEKPPQDTFDTSRYATTSEDRS